MKRDVYLKALETVTNFAQTTWDAEKMRDALIQARIKLENRLHGLKQQDFKNRLGGR